jgi:hypothetical protein
VGTVISVTVRVTESRLPAGYLATELGQTTTVTLPGGGKYILVSFLSSPLRPATVQEYVVFAIDADADEYRWTFPPPGGGAATNYTTDIGTVRHTFSDFGLSQVKVEVVLNGAVVATLNLLQGVAQPNPTLEQAISQSATLMDRDSEVLRELWNDFNDYINLAADATGVNGVPPRFVAAILDRECWGRPKIGTSGAADLIAADDAGHIRENEEDAMAFAYEAGKPIFGAGSPFLGAPPVPASLGPGQIGQPTCAALEDMIPWREGAAAGTTGLEFDRKFVMWLNATDFISIEYVKQVDVFNLTRFPKTNIKLLAKLLARLKNRPHRWPTVAKDDVIDTEKLVEIVATEYNIGPTATPAASAKPNMYGELHIRTRVDTPADDFALFQ